MPKNSLRKCCTASSLKKAAFDSQRLASICKALAHPVRLQIVAHLKQIDRCVCGQLVKALPLAQSTVSQHLKILKSSGLVIGEVEGPRTCYCINHEAVAELKSLVDRI